MPPVSEEILDIPLDRIHRSLFQPREYFDPAAMEATRRSILEKGQKVPAIVRPIKPGNPLYQPEWTEIHYELADGERRFRCAKELGLPTLKAVVRDIKDEEMLDYSMTTQDSLPLNPIEKAKVFFRLSKEFGKTQAEIAKSFNLKQQQVSEYIRLLELPPEIMDLTARAVISLRHARELLKISNKDDMYALANKIVSEKLSTRAISKIIKSNSEKNTKSNKFFSDNQRPWIKFLISFNISIFKLLYWSIGKKDIKIGENIATDISYIQISVLFSTLLFFILERMWPSSSASIGSAIFALNLFNYYKNKDIKR